MRIPYDITTIHMALAHAPVAQLDRAPDYGSGGLRFESSRARHPLSLILPKAKSSTSAIMRRNEVQADDRDGACETDAAL
jgi:hypothetical protein